ncbi:hypothetical protein ACFE04_005981 [Oxalis oulophora]
MPPKEDGSLKKTKPKIGVGRVSGSQNLTSTFDLIEEMDYFYMKIFRARGLPPNCLDPFVEIKIGNYRGTTLYFENKRIWEWDQAFAFKVQQIQDTVVDIKVRDRAAIVPEESLIGSLKFTYPTDAPRRVIPDTPFAPQWYSLENSKGVRFGPELMLSLWTGTQSDEVFSTAWHSDACAVDGSGIANTRGKVYLAPKLWYLRVNIIQAQELIPIKSETPQVFVKATVGDVTLRTKVSPNKNLNPKWGEDLMFVVAEPFNDFLYLSVEDIGEDKVQHCLGKLVIPLKNVEKRSLPVIGVSQLWHNLERYVVDGELINEKVKFASKIQLAVCLEGGYHVFDEPVGLSSDFRSTFKGLWTGVLGVFELGILNARGLTGMKLRDGRKTTDAYCVAKYGPKWVKTRTIVNSLDPQWNEQYTWEVYDLNTVITIGIFDNMHLGRERIQALDSLIGKLKIRLSTLQCDKIYTYAYPLFVLQPSGLKKMGEIELAMRFTCSSYFNLFWSYINPPLPKMNYAKPLSDDEIEKLRGQAVDVISWRLSRAEPPIRREVVRSILLIGPNIWSLRKGKSNLARLKAYLDLYDKVQGWYAYFRSWKNPIISVLVITSHLILVWCPKVVVFLFLAFIVCYVLYRGWSMPKDPPCLDIKLSMADSVHADEIDEELDTFPSSMEGEILRMRYDRMRRFGGQYVAFLGKVADQLERYMALFSWRDPRCSFWFLIFCVVAIFGMYYVPYPLQAFLSWLVLNSLKHPKMNFNLAFGIGYLLKRLPPKSDTLIIPGPYH